MESAVEQICREAGARVSTSWSETLTSLTATLMREGWRSLQKACQFLEECSWPWMRLWCPPIMGTGHPSGRPTKSTE